MPLSALGPDYDGRLSEPQYVKGAQKL